MQKIGPPQARKCRKMDLEQGLGGIWAGSGETAGEESGQKALPKHAKKAKNAEKPFKTCRKMVHRRPENAEK